MQYGVSTVRSCTLQIVTGVRNSKMVTKACG